MLTAQRREGLHGEVWIGTTQAADILKVSPGTVYKLIEEGLIESYQQRGKHSHWRIRKTSVDRLIERWISEAEAAGGLTEQQ